MGGEALMFRRIRDLVLGQEPAPVSRYSARTYPNGAWVNSRVFAKDAEGPVTATGKIVNVKIDSPGLIEYLHRAFAGGALSVIEEYAHHRVEYYPPIVPHTKEALMDWYASQEVDEGSLND
jgi:hypothetical protein